MKNRFYITTAIPYVNADPHVGFAMELIQADVLARYHRLKGDNVRFVTGTDENSIKNVLAAEKNNLLVQDYIDQKAEVYKALPVVLNLSNDDFIRTTEDRNVRGAQKLWELCAKSGDIYKKEYTGLYCIQCEEFKSPKDIVDGCCVEHRRTPLQEVSEENYFFRLSKYQKQLEQLIDSQRLRIVPDNKRNEIKEFLRQGLEDFSISRSNVRAKNWGVPVPGDSSQMMYVWFDALANYINALGFADNGELFKQYWEENDQRCHVVGKGITRFHALYWPGMLLSAGLKVPSTIYVHGYATIAGEKISKSSKLTLISPFDLVKKYGADVLRYFLLREIPSDQDGDFSEKKLIDRYNGDLANGLGNLVARVATLIENNLPEGLTFDSAHIESTTLQAIEDAKNLFTVGLENFKLHESLAAIWQLIAHADRYVNDTKPWALAKEDKEKFETVMVNLVKMILHITWALAPFMPETADKILEVFDIKKEAVDLEGQRLKVQKGAVLFPRLGI